MANSNPPPLPKGRGRPKGAPNKVSSDIKAMIIEALGEAGGVKYLLEQSSKNPTAFMGLVGKVLPMTILGDSSAPLFVISAPPVGKDANEWLKNHAPKS